MDEFVYNFVKKTGYFWWEIRKKDNSKAPPYWNIFSSGDFYDTIYHENKNIPAEHFLRIYTYRAKKETKIFKKILEATLNLGGSNQFKSYYLYDSDLSIYEGLVPLEDIDLIKLTIQLYEENYNDRVTNLKAAYAAKQLGAVQSGCSTA